MLVFVSHSSLDREAALAMVGALESRGAECWLALRDVAPGENYQKAIEAAIRRSGALVLIFSANANNSNEIMKEISLASKNRLAVIPVRIEDMKPFGALDYELSTCQWIDAFKNWNAAMDSLARRLLAIEPVIVGPERPPDAGQPPRKWRRRRTIPPLAGLATVAAAVVAGAWMAYGAHAWRLHPGGGPVNPATQVNEFRILVTVGVLPKTATIRRVTFDRYVEIDEGGSQTVMEVLSRITYRGCPGTLLHDGAKYIYFPDRLCPAMQFYISDNGRDLAVASRMLDVI